MKIDPSTLKVGHEGVALPEGVRELFLVPRNISVEVEFPVEDDGVVLEYDFPFYVPQHADFSTLLSIASGFWHRIQYIHDRLGVTVHVCVYCEDALVIALFVMAAFYEGFFMYTVKIGKGSKTCLRYIPVGEYRFVGDASYLLTKLK
ncbi:MAG: hypothetical protein KatS3mg031_2864 [Chitinophagales bacterium]|nr:MAG: hypothetical protein KatS3mg031_2856 [Chitinophagales bacterium]GIV35329.1 MAG: hypothetical protein KatS3mg031_2864 [Chitinophagales bacterium]